MTWTSLCMKRSPDASSRNRRAMVSTVLAMAMPVQLNTVVTMCSFSEVGAGNILVTSLVLAFALVLPFVLAGAGTGLGAGVAGALATGWIRCSRRCFNSG